MTERDTTPPQVPLGVGMLIGDSFSILFRNFVPVVVIAFVPSILGVLLSGYLVGFETLLSLDVGESTSGGADALTKSCRPRCLFNHHRVPGAARL